MKYLLDTNTCIKYLNGTSENIKQNLLRRGFNEIAICSVVKAELIFGAIKSSRPDQNMARVESFLSQFPSLPFNDEAALHYGHIRSSLEKIGRPIGPNDLLIASIALANHLVLVTNNVSEFSRIQELQIEDWEQ